MIPRLLRRLAWSLVTIWAIATTTFFVYGVLPEDPARIMAGPQARPRDVARLRQQLGLDQPLGRRYALYLGNLVRVGAPAEAKPGATFALGPLHVDLGQSYFKRRPVAVLIRDALPATLLLGALALAVQLVIGVSAGAIAARHRNTALDGGIVAATLLGVSAPTFLTGLLLQHVLGRTLGWLPLDGYGAGVGGTLRAAVLPALTLGLFGAAYYTRLVRDELITLAGADHVRTARAKGLSGAAVLFKHLLRNALLPLSTVVGLDVGALVSGAIVTEKLFRWPGIGSLTVDAIVEHDGPVIMGVVLLSATAVVISGVVVDVVYTLLDPRVRKR